jgi:hypothetical protein
MNNLKTINVIVKTDENNLNVKSFNDNTKGNIEAENVFKSILKENNISNIDFFVEEGFYNDGLFSVYLIHSI